jgi:hypothetical protein
MVCYVMAVVVALVALVVMDQSVFLIVFDLSF